MHVKLKFILLFITNYSLHRKVFLFIRIIYLIIILIHPSMAGAANCAKLG
jgi:hypothetical protein